MTTSRSPHEDEERILSALRISPGLRDCILEMIDITEDPTKDQKLKLGDDAEDAVVGVIQKTGRTLLEEWAQKRSEQAAEEVSQKPKHRPHGKKSNLANFDWINRYHRKGASFEMKNRKIQVYE